MTRDIQMLIEDALAGTMSQIWVAPVARIMVSNADTPWATTAGQTLMTLPSQNLSRGAKTNPSWAWAVMTREADWVWLRM